MVLLNHSHLLLPSTENFYLLYSWPPPPRKTGYQEKEFDKIISQFLSNGIKIKNMQTQSHVGPHQSGVWVFLTLKGNPKALEQIKQEPLSPTESVAETIFGLELTESLQEENWHED